VWRGKSAAVEAVVAVQIIAWGMFIALPYFDSLVSMKVGQILELFLPEVAWGLFAMCLGAVQLVSVWRNWKNIREMTALLAAAWWMGLWVGFVLTNPSSTAVALNPTIAGGEIWAFFQLRKSRNGGDRNDCG
jgi:hypothetical protein